MVTTNVAGNTIVINIFEPKIIEFSKIFEQSIYVGLKKYFQKI